MQASDIMTASPVCATPEDTAGRVAQLMAENDCGCLPVVAARGDSRVIGVITDRDLAVRGLAQGKGPETPTRQLMTADPCCCAPDADVREVERLMSERQVRRIVVADADGRCVGIVAQADLAHAAELGRDVTDREVATVVEAISGPGARPIRALDRRAERGGERGTGAPRSADASQDWRL
jgi:CBS domain-containing protein